MKKIEAFKYLIKEFHENELPAITERELKLPQTSKIVSLVGSRRSGKTFYFYQLAKELIAGGVAKDRILYVDFSDDRLFELKLSELNALLEAYYELYPSNKTAQKYFFFDEIQDVDGWEAFVRRVAEKEKAQVYVTGSSSKLLSKEIATSLRGRTLAFQLFPLSFREFLSFKGIKLEKGFAYSNARFEVKKLLGEYLDYGGFPEVALAEALKHDILSNYYEVMLYRDIVERFSVRNTRLLKRLGKFLLTNVSSQFSINSYYNAVKSEAKVSKDTVLEYLSYLEDANVVYLTQIFSYSLKTQQANPSKAYCVDNGLRNAVALRFSKDDGRLAENLVFLELKRRGHEVYYWRGKKEVDFVLRQKDGKLSAINVSYTDEIDAREAQGLHEFKEKFGARKLTILTKDLDKKGGGITYLPLWRWLLEKQR
ncbi:ATP-binding protein [Candidatus Micrarchaeota archaeon]|nr:ATP-binding protein [Candidatus Micrarchaeota archaeon]